MRTHEAAKTIELVAASFRSDSRRVNRAARAALSAGVPSRSVLLPGIEAFGRRFFSGRLFRAEEFAFDFAVRQLSHAHLCHFTTRPTNLASIPDINPGVR